LILLVLSESYSARDRKTEIDFAGPVVGLGGQKVAILAKASITMRPPGEFVRMGSKLDFGLRGK
jgi:hypothetical protein